MKYISRPFYLSVVIIMTLISCSNNNTATSKEIAKDTSEKKFNPAGDQKQTDTYDPKATATDTMYKNRDSILK